LGISFDYNLQKEAAESLELVKVRYSDGSGAAVQLPDGSYDPGTGRVSFTATRSGSYDVDLVFDD
jgi:hypothetical protein